MNYAESIINPTTSPGLIVRCQRCSKDGEAHHRVQSEAMDIVVCDDCAQEGRMLGLSVVAMAPSQEDAGIGKKGEVV